MAADRKDKVVLKLKKAASRPSAPGNWKESDASSTSAQRASGSAVLTGHPQTKTRRPQAAASRS
jgi:SAGA-associated factor 73